MATSTPLIPTITAAGLAAIFNQQNDGLKFTLTAISFGAASYAPNGLEAALRDERVRAPIASGGRISPTQIHVYGIAMAPSGQPFFAGETGFWGKKDPSNSAEAATLLAVYSKAGTPTLYLSDVVATSASYVLGLQALPPNSVVVQIDPSASAALLLIGNHVTDPDPHPQYAKLSVVEQNCLGLIIALGG